MIPGTGDGLMAICDYDRSDVEGTGKTYDTEMESINIKLTVTGRTGVRTETVSDRNTFRITIYEGRHDGDLTGRTDVTGIYNGKKYTAYQEIDLP